MARLALLPPLALAFVLTGALAVAGAQEPTEDELAGFDPIRSVSVEREQRGTKVRGTVDVAAAGSDVVARIKRDGELLGRVTWEGVASGPLEAAVPLFRSARKLLARKGRLRVRFVIAVDPPDDPPQRVSRRVSLRR